MEYQRRRKETVGEVSFITQTGQEQDIRKIRGGSRLKGKHSSLKQSL